jgi:hypothetical protein
MEVNASKAIINHPYFDGLWHPSKNWWFWGWFVFVLLTLAGSRGRAYSHHQASSCALAPGQQARVTSVALSVNMDSKSGGFGDKLSQRLSERLQVAAGGEFDGDPLDANQTFAVIQALKSVKENETTPVGRQYCRPTGRRPRKRGKDRGHWPHLWLKHWDFDENVV